MLQLFGSNPHDSPFNNQSMNKNTNRLQSSTWTPAGQRLGSRRALVFEP
jgi:hypothetical protein